MYISISGMCKVFWYKIRFGNSVCFDGCPAFERTSRINLKKGVFHAGKGFAMKPNSYIAVMEGGKVTIGNCVTIARNSIIVCHDCITIGENCAIAPNVLIYDHVQDLTMKVFDRTLTPRWLS